MPTQKQASHDLKHTTQHTPSMRIIPSTAPSRDPPTSRCAAPTKRHAASWTGHAGHAKRPSPVPTHPHPFTSERPDVWGTYGAAMVLAVHDPIGGIQCTCLRHTTRQHAAVGLFVMDAERCDLLADVMAIGHRQSVMEPMISGQPWQLPVHNDLQQGAPSHGPSSLSPPAPDVWGRPREYFGRHLRNTQTHQMCGCPRVDVGPVLCVNGSVCGAAICRWKATR